MSSGILWIVILAFLVVQVVCAIEMAVIAKMKGHDDGKYFLLPLLCGIPGFLVVLSLPDRKAHPSEGEALPDTDALPEL